MTDTALLVIDVQEGIFGDENYPVHDGDGVLTRLGSLIEKAHAAGTPVIYVQHEGGEGDPLHPSQAGHAIHSRIAPKDGDQIIKKSHPDSFQDTNLQSVLESKGIKNLVIGGCETPMCVDTTTRRAYSLGYKVTLIADGHSAPQFGSLTGPQFIGHHNEILGAFAKVKPAAEIEFEPQPEGMGGAKASMD